MFEGFESFVIAAMIGLLMVMAGFFAAAVEFVTSKEFEKEKKR